MLLVRKNVNVVFYPVKNKRERSGYATIIDITTKPCRLEKKTLNNERPTSKATKPRGYKTVFMLNSTN